LPTPETQIPVVANYRTIAVLDMGWERFKVAVEYDGDQHRTSRRQYVRDLRRLKELERLGWIVIRVIAEDRPENVLRQVREALRSRGYRDT
jgi:very-short-patch-repair endonuclease